MKKSVFFMAFLLVFFLLWGCGGEDTDTYTMNNMPEDYRVTLPSSLNEGSKSRGTVEDALGYIQLQECAQKVKNGKSVFPPW